MARAPATFGASTGGTGNVVAFGCAFPECRHATVTLEAGRPGAWRAISRTTNNSSCDACADTSIRNAPGSASTAGSAASRRRANAPVHVADASAPDACLTRGVTRRSALSTQWCWNRPMSHIQYPLTSALKRGVTRTMRAPFAHSGFALSQTVVLQPFEQSVHVVSTATGLSHGREANR